MELSDHIMLGKIINKRDKKSSSISNDASKWLKYGIFYEMQKFLQISSRVQQLSCKGSWTSPSYVHSHESLLADGMYASGSTSAKARGKLLTC